MLDKISPDMLLKNVEQLKGATNQQPMEPAADDKVAGADFKSVLGQLINDVDQAQKEADVSLKKLATGETNSIQEVVVKMEQADVSFKLTLEIRNKLLQAYKDIMSSQA